MNTDRHSFKSDQTDALSLSVYNVGYEKCQGLHSWGSGVRDHYLIHHIISGKGVYRESIALAQGTLFSFTHTLL